VAAKKAAKKRGRRPKGTGSLREIAPGKWRLRIAIGVDSAGKTRTASVVVAAENQTDAEDKLREFRTQHAATSPDARALTFGRHLRDWLAFTKPHLSPTTWHGYRAIVETRLVPALGDVPLDKLTTRRFDTLWAQLAKPTPAHPRGLATASIQQTKAVARRALNQAIVWDLLQRNPAQLSTVPATRRREIEPPPIPTLMHVVATIAGYDEHFARLALVAASLGARRGEIAGLHWNKVDLDNGLVRIDRAVIRYRDEDGVLRIVEKDTKTHQSRTIEIGPKTVTILRAHHAAQEARLRAVLGSRVRLRKTAYVFSREPDGAAPLDPQWITDAWGTATARAKVEGVRLHDLRHLFASALIADGQDIVTVSKMLGHSLVSTTSNIYAHMLPGKGKAVASAIDRIIHGGDGDDVAALPA
jgi:integrase